jgi:hypothetical protein
MVKCFVHNAIVHIVDTHLQRTEDDKEMINFLIHSVGTNILAYPISVNLTLRMYIC